MRTTASIAPFELTPSGSRYEAKLAELSGAISSRSWDQPVKVVPLEGDPPKFVRGYFTQEKFVNDKTPSEMGVVLGAYGKFSSGAFVMEFKSPLRKRDFEAKAYTYLPDGKPYEHDPDEKSSYPEAVHLNGN